MPRGGRAPGDVSRNPARLRQILIVDAVDAQRAFLHHAAVLVELARTVRAGPGAQFAADAERGVDQHDSVLGALVGGTGRTHGYALRLFAMKAVLREIDGAAVLALADLERVHAVEPHAPGLRAVGIELRQRPRLAERVPLLAARHAGVAADAGVEIDDEPELFCAGLRGRQAGHAPLPMRSRRSRRIAGGETWPGRRDSGANCGSA